MADDTDCSPIPFNRQLASLQPGETVATARRIAPGGDISGTKAKLRASINPAVSKVRKQTEGEFVSDTGEFLTQDGHAVVVVTVTRTA